MSANGREYEMRGKRNQTSDTEVFSLVYGVTQTADQVQAIQCSIRGNTSITLKWYCTSSNEKMSVQYSFYVVYDRYLLLHESGL